MFLLKKVSYLQITRMFMTKQAGDSCTSFKKKQVSRKFSFRRSSMKTFTTVLKCYMTLILFILFLFSLSQNKTKSLSSHLTVNTNTKNHCIYFISMSLFTNVYTPITLNTAQIYPHYTS